MLNPELYQKTVDVLYAAYFNNTLKHGDCTACAVGNILRPHAERLNLRLSQWSNLFITLYDRHGNYEQLIAEEGYYNVRFFGTVQSVPIKENNGFDTVACACKLVDASGYSVQQLAKIEYAFETAPQGNDVEDYMFNGLVAVLDVLAQIHEVDESAAAASLQPFQSHHAVKTT